MKKIGGSPSLLKTDDLVSVIAPSGRADIDRTKQGISIIEQWGLKVEEGDNLFREHGPFAGDDEERLYDLQRSLDRSDIKAIFCARGGYGLSRIIERIDLKGVIESPKWVVGFSDITLLHYYINRYANMPAIHAEMLLNYQSAGIDSESLVTLRKLLFGGESSLQWEPGTFKAGETRAILAGGNLSLLCSVLGSGLADYLKGKILFIEETGEELYRIDRMLLSLRLSGVFNNISGLIVGGMSGIADSSVPFGETVEEIVLNAIRGFDFPVAFQFPAGHIENNRAICLGKEYLFRVDQLSAVLAC